MRTAAFVIALVSIACACASVYFNRKATRLVREVAARRVVRVERGLILDEAEFQRAVAEAIRELKRRGA